MPNFHSHARDGEADRRIEDPAGSDLPDLDAARLIREAEARVARQAAIVEGFELAGDEPAAERANETLAVMRTGLALALLCLAVEHAGTADEPERRAQPDA